jgi:hypothetical protein
LTTNITIANIQLFLIIFATIFYFGKIFASKFAKKLDKKIDEYIGISQFKITKGDENALYDAQIKNSSITKEILTKIGITIITTLVAFGLRHLLELWIK